MPDPIYPSSKIAEIYQPLSPTNLLNESLTTGPDLRIFHRVSEALDYAESLASQTYQDSVVVFDNQRYLVYPVEELSQLDADANQIPGFYQIEATAQANLSFVAGEAEHLQYIQPVQNRVETQKKMVWLQDLGYPLDQPLPPVIQLLWARLPYEKLETLNQQPNSLVWLQQLEQRPFLTRVLQSTLAYNGANLEQALAVTRYLDSLQNQGIALPEQVYEDLIQKHYQAAKPQNLIRRIQALSLSLEAEYQGFLCGFDLASKSHVFQQLAKLPTGQLNLAGVLQANPWLVSLSDLKHQTKTAAEVILAARSDLVSKDFLSLLTYYEFLVQQGVQLDTQDIAGLAHYPYASSQDTLANLAAYGVIREMGALKTSLALTPLFATLEAKLLEGKLQVVIDNKDVSLHAEAVYCPIKNRVHLRAFSIGDTFQRSTWVHELSHALQDINPDYHLQTGETHLSRGFSETQAFIYQGIYLVENLPSVELEALKDKHDFYYILIELASAYMEKASDAPEAHHRFSVILSYFKMALNELPSYQGRLNEITLNNGI